MKAKFIAAARIELKDAINYYDSMEAGLGKKFLVEVESAVRQIERFPDAWHPLGQNVRRCRTKRFPYGIVYYLRQNRPFVIAISHLRRKTEYWRDRIENRDAE